jgi:NADH dehydrogenase
VPRNALRGASSSFPFAVFRSHCHGYFNCCISRSSADRSQETSTAPHRIVIVGGGAGGLELATRLGDTLGRRGLTQVTLIEKANTHFWKPHLHEIAAGTVDLHTHAVDYLAQSH